MAKFARKSDGRRIFTDAFKRKQIRRVRRGELSVAELGRELGIARSLLQRWKRLETQGAMPTGVRRGPVMPAGRPESAQIIRELQLLIGKQTVEIEGLRAALGALEKGRRFTEAPNG
jgi:transposase-like protein